MTNHTLSINPENFCGHLNKDLPPVLRIAPGDSVTYRIPDAGWSLSAHDANGERETIRPDVEEAGLGHCLAGPISVEGATPGMLLEIEVDHIVTSNWGWTAVGWPTEMNDFLDVVRDPAHLVQWTIDRKSATATSDFGVSVPITPFLGFMGVVPPMAGEFNTIEPFAGGGNMDCRELVVGTRLFLPIHVDDALFLCGDCHAAQGDGELCGTAVECAAESVTLTFNLHEYLPELNGSENVCPESPVALTPKGWLAIGLHPVLDEAMKRAAHVMLQIISAKYDIDRHQATAVAAAAVDFRISQAVNGMKGVHAVLRS